MVSLSIPDTEKKTIQLSTESLEEEKKEKDKQKNDIFSITERYLVQRYEFRNNKVSNRIEQRTLFSDTEVYSEVKESNLYVELQKNHINISPQKLIALLKSDFVPEYDPFFSYFETLRIKSKGDFDPEKDYIKELCSFVKVTYPEEQELFYRHFKKHLVRSVACSLGRAFNKQCFVLVSPAQNIGKTSFFRFLIPKELHDYYSEELSIDKDGLITLTNNFMINIDELSILNKAEINTLKSYFSKDLIKVRLPYDAKATTIKRRANFFASTNKEDFLADETGSVRWVAFNIDHIHFNQETGGYTKVVNVDNVWLQAYLLFLNGYKYELNKNEIDENEQRNMRYFKQTAEMETLRKYARPAEENEPESDFYSTTEILENLQGRISQKLNLNNLGKALKMLGYERKSKRTSNQNYPSYGYYVIFV